MVVTQKPQLSAGTEKLETEHSEGEEQEQQQQMQLLVVEEQYLLLLTEVALVWL